MVAASASNITDTTSSAAAILYGGDHTIPLLQTLNPKACNKPVVLTAYIARVGAVQDKQPSCQPLLVDEHSPVL